ncbi:MAG: hypothetical protein M1275_02490 [Patescibacteria group bacterium]|nr:hypothetical protein [Patescibacteria group bacterium]
MPLRKGQAPVAKGVKGRSGRKSAYWEKANADLLWSLLTEEYSKKELQQLITDNSKKFNVLQALQRRALLGDVRAQTVMFSKAFPDKMVAEIGKVKRLLKFDL